MEKRLNALCENLPEGADAALIISPENRRYFTNFPSSAGFLIVTRDDKIFFTDSRYIEAARQTITGCGIEELISAKKQLPEYFKDKGVNTLYIEAESMTVGEKRRYGEMFGGIEILCDGKLDDAIMYLRNIKDEEEKNLIVSAQRIAEKAFEHICKFIRAGVTERDIALELDFFMLKNGAEGLSFETIAVSGVNSSKPHGVPGDKKIERGDFITMDYGALVNGYHSDMTRTVAVGEVSSKQAEVYETVLKAQLNALSAVKPGVSCKAADAAARDVIKNAGYGDFYRHGTGHGVGIEIHEQPVLSPSSDQILEPGHIVTVEPGVYLPCEFGVRIEDMAYITSQGCENLTSTPKNLIVLPE